MTEQHDSKTPGSAQESAPLQICSASLRKDVIDAEVPHWSVYGVPDCKCTSFATLIGGVQSGASIFKMTTDVFLAPKAIHD